MLIIIQTIGTKCPALSGFNIMTVIKKNFKDKNQAVEYTKKNLEDLVINLTNVSEDVVRTYAEFKHIPIRFDAIDEDDYLSHYQLMIQILELINISEVYLSEVKSDVQEYFKPDLYHDKIESKVKSDINDHLYDYVDAFSHDVDVVYNDDDILSSSKDKPIIHIDDGHIDEIKLFK